MSGKVNLSCINLHDIHINSFKKHSVSANPQPAQIICSRQPILQNLTFCYDFKLLGYFPPPKWVLKTFSDPTVMSFSMSYYYSTFQP